MKLSRIGVIVLLIGVTLLFATNIRGRTISGGGSIGRPYPLGPFMLEPRETTLVLREVSPENVTVTVFVVDAKSWQAIQNISKVTPVFTASEMKKLYSVTFRLDKRGLYYIVVTTNTGSLADEVEMAIEQRGLAGDLLTLSIAISIIGAITLIIDRLKSIIQKKQKQRNVLS